MSEDLILGFLAGFLVCACLASILWSYWVKQAAVEWKQAQDEADAFNAEQIRQFVQRNGDP